MLRALLVLQSPRAVFVAMRDDSEPAARARQEPVTAIVLLAGIAAVLWTPVAATLLDDPARDGVVVAVWAFVGGAFYGIAGYWLAGLLLRGAIRLAGGGGSYRLARHVVAFAAAPLALSLLVWPVRLSVYGGDVFRSGGGDGGAGDRVFAALALLCLAWSLVLLAIGVRTVHGWSWPRALGAVVALYAVVGAALYGLSS
jgi:hypothetical protein